MAQIKVSSMTFHDNAAAYGGDKSIMSGSATESCSLFGYELLDDSFSFTGYLNSVKTVPGFIPSIPASAVKLYDGDGAYLRAARWCTDVKKQYGTGLVTYTLKSVVGLLMSMPPHNGGMYSGDKTVGDVIDEIFDGINPNVIYVVSPDVATIPLYGRLPRANRRDNLAKILIATGATLTYAPSGLLMIRFLQNTAYKRLSTVYLDSLDIQEDIAYNRVSVTEHSF